MIYTSLKNILFCLLLSLPCLVNGQIIRSQTDKWSTDLDGDDLVDANEAGSDLNSTLETSSTFNQLDIAGINPTTTWKVTVSKEDINWTSTFIPSVQRTSIGSPCGSCAGVNIGTSSVGYVQVTDIEQDFIFGAGVVNNIDLQYKIDGITLAVDADTYQTRIVFTLYGDP